MQTSPKYLQICINLHNDLRDGEAGISAELFNRFQNFKVFCDQLSKTQLGKIFKTHKIPFWIILFFLLWSVQENICKW